MTDTPAEREVDSTWPRLRRRKVVQWGLAYAAGAWVLLQVLGFATDTNGWPTVIAQLAMLGLTLGLPIVVTLAWYHGDRGQQRITGSELAVLTFLLVLSGGVLWLYAQRSVPTTTTDLAVKPASPAAAINARPSIAVLPFADWLEHARPHLTGTPYLAAADALFHAYRGEQTEAAAAAERVVALRPRNAIALRLLRDAELRAGRPHRSRARYQSALPELFESPLPPLNRTNYEVAIDVALVLRSIGDDARSAQLLAGSLDYLQGLVRVGRAGYGFADVRILALQGRRAEALNALGQAERAGWRAGWRYARSYDPALDSIRADPAFKAVFADIERDMAQQRARLAARPKDAPLDLAVNQ